MFYRNVIAFDRVKQRLEIVSIVFTEEAGGSHERLRKLYDEAVARTKEVEKTIFETPAPPRPQAHNENAGNIHCNQTGRAGLLKRACDR